MTFSEAVRSVLSKYATFSGRASRSEFWWWWWLASILIGLVTFLVDSALFGGAADAAWQPFSSLVALGLLLPNLAVNVRRLHDTDRTGWWLLLVLIPIVGFLVLLYFWIQKGTAGDNRFGLSPFR